MITATKNRTLRQRAIGRTVSDLPASETLVANIVAICSSATDEDQVSGTIWYEQAYNTAAEIADEYSLSHDQAAGVIAALSPQTPWDLNVRFAHVLCSGGSGVHFTDAETKARRILAGESPSAVLGGRKVRAFYALIRDPSAAGPVVIDRHAIAIAYAGPRDPYLYCPPNKILDRIGAYQVVAGAYRSAARRLGLSPHQVQAITWLAWRHQYAAGWADRDPF